MRNFREHNSMLGRSRTFFAGVLVVFGLAIFPVSAQADILQSTFGNGYGFLDKEGSIQSVQTSTSIEVRERGTFKPTFGEGYAFLERDSLTSTVLTKGPVTRQVAKIFTGAADPNTSRTSAFQSLFGEGYGAVIQTQQ